MGEYKPKEYWTLRYEKFNISSSGHKDLPIAYNSWLYKIKKKKIRAAAFRELDDFSNVNVLELGCGTGVYVEMWQECGVHRLTGIDIAANAVDELKKKFPEFTFAREDLSDSSLAQRYGDEKYSLITVIGVLVHIIDDDLFRRAVQNISKLVKKDGVVLVSDYVVRKNTAAEKKHT